MSFKKRKGGASLTGGTGDVNPQFMSFSAVQTGADTATSGSIQPPVSLSTGQNLAMEILKVFMENTTINLNAAGNFFFTLSTKNFGTTQPTLGFGDATVIARYNVYAGFTTSGASAIIQPYEVDLTDGAGHGLLVGNQNLYWTLTSTTTGNTNRVNCKILYRAKRISDGELLGIVLQSNQN